MCFFYHALKSFFRTLRVENFTIRAYYGRESSETIVMNRIAEHREKAGIKQRELVAALGWTQTRISNYEAGRRTAGLAECRAITAALNRLGADCSLDDIFPPELNEPKAA